VLAQIITATHKHL